MAARRATRANLAQLATAEVRAAPTSAARLKPAVPVVQDRARVPITSIFNRTQATLDIAGCYVSDDSSNRVTFPTGASIAPTSYVLVRLQQSTSTGTVTSCLGYTPCYDGISWGISASGEVVSLTARCGSWCRLRDAKGTLLDQLSYPDQNGSKGLPDGEALGRVPDGGTTVTGILVSPGATNNEAP